MQTRYSKPSVDIRREFERLKQVDGNILSRQREASQHLTPQPIREHCLLCRHKLEHASCFHHRSVTYILCEECQHIQSQHQPSDAYPLDTPAGIGFDEVYPDQSDAAYHSRKTRVYEPKWQWILDALLTAGLTEDNIRQKHWLELGAGAGYFLSCLQSFGIDNLTGIEKDRTLMAIGNEKLKANIIQYHDASIDSAIKTHPADVYCAFFVLEHVPDLYSFFQALSHCPKGTLFAFSVPTFGLSTLLESAFNDHAGRNLDNALHVQSFTNESISYALKIAGYHMISQWIFGQDTDDLKRLLSLKLDTIYPAPMRSFIESKLSELVDPLQAVIDKAHFSDSRHILCIKE